MIGMVNVQCDTPLDYYASAPSRKESVRVRNESDTTHVRTPSVAKRTPSWRPLFTGQAKSKKAQTRYLDDGRKIVDGRSNNEEPNKLWEELFLRSFAHRIESEIQSPSPMEAHKNLENELEKLRIQDKSFYRSTYSLVSPARVESTDFEDLEVIQPKGIRSNSSSERPCSFLTFPFIKSIKGNKKKNTTEPSKKL
ncbi:unnamed protein product [Caenorhabditis auriculariae]|uniref:Uncharacterized protein n=1 Tax=Caenorhabditis auriculariae TaxID=2777116 RepID=A0A8S1HI21_9PELO|nr:unnamed protein product [Caenorhabditis auriculariae]